MSGVTIHPRGTADLLAHQLSEMRAAGRDAMRHAVHITHEEMSHLAPGHLSEDIAERVGSGAGSITGAVFPTPDWAKYVDEGTGIYVEHHHPITPLASRAQGNPRAALKLKGGRFRRSVRGQRGQHFVQRTREHMEGPVGDILEKPAFTVTARLAKP